MFSSIQHRFKSTFSYFGYGSEPSQKLPEQISKNLETQDDLAAATTLNEYRITPKPPSIWKKVASFAMSYLLFSSSESSLQQSTQTSWMPAVGLEPLALIAGLSLFPDFAYAQSTQTTFFQVFGSIENDQVTDIAVNSEGEIFVIGDTIIGAGSFDLLLSKFSSNGTLIWAKTFGGANAERGNAITITSEGDLVVTGYAPRATLEVLLAKFSSNGTLLWANTLGGMSNDQGLALTATSDGDLVVAGYTTSSGAGFEDVLLSKFANNGTLLWTKTLGGSGNDQGLAVAHTLEGEIFVTGYTFSFGAGSTDLLLSKFSSNGTLVWAQTVGGMSSEEGLSLAATPEGDLLVTGDTTSFRPSNNEMLLAKFSNNSTLLWANILGGASSGSDQGHAVTITSEGNIIVAGFTSSFGAGAADTLISKYSSNGTLFWASTLGGASAEWGRAITTTSEGDIIIGGFTASFGAGIHDILLAKFNAQGGIENCLPWQSISPQVQSITPIITDVLQSITVTEPAWTFQDATGSLNVMDVTSLLVQATECYTQTADSQISSGFSQSTRESSSVSSSKSKIPSSSSAIRNTPLTSSRSSFSSPSAQSTSIESSQGTRGSGSVLSSKSKIQSFSTAIRNTSLTSTRSNFSSLSSTHLSKAPSLPSTTEIPAPSTGTIPSINTLFYDQSYSIIVNGETIGTFYFTGGSGQLNSDNVNTLIIQFDGDIEDGETITLFTIPAGEESQWEDIVLSYESESGCDTTEGVFTTTSEEEEHSYQLIFEYESECSYAATIKLAAIPVLGGGFL